MSPELTGNFRTPSLITVAFVLFIFFGRFAATAYGQVKNEVHDAVDIEISSVGRPVHHFHIPKAYLNRSSVSSFDQWRGGKRSFISLRAAIFWSAEGMQPWPDAALLHIEEDPHPDAGVEIDVRPSKNFFYDDYWETVILPQLDQETTTYGDLLVYKYKKGNPMREGEEVYFTKIMGQEGTKYILCLPNAQIVRVGCTGHADLSEDIVFNYIFHAGNLLRWREVDTRIRALLNSFKVD